MLKKISFTASSIGILAFSQFALADGYLPAPQGYTAAPPLCQDSCRL